MPWGPSGPLPLLHAWGPRVGFSRPWVRPLRGRGAQRCALSMPRFSLAEIIFLRAITPAYPANHADIIFDITDGNLRDSFDIIKRYMDGMTVGEWPETAGSARCPWSSSPLWLSRGLSQTSPAPARVPWSFRAQLETCTCHSRCEKRPAGRSHLLSGDPGSLSLPTCSCCLLFSC